MFLVVPGEVAQALPLAVLWLEALGMGYFFKLSIDPYTHPAILHFGSFLSFFWLLLLGRSPHKNCKNDLDDQT